MAGRKKYNPSASWPGKRTFSKYIKPMLAEIYDEPFDSEEWIFEIKWDGYRAITEIKDGMIKFYSRNGISLAERYLVIFDDLKKIRRNMILDGEVVAFNEKGKASFQTLQHLADQEYTDLRYYVFDLLSLEGENTKELPLTDRKKLLEKLIPPSLSTIHYCDHIREEGKLFFKEVIHHDMEGIIAKKADSLYRPGARTGDWLKIRNHKTSEAVLAGFTEPSGERKKFGSLVLGTYRNGKLVFSGHVGTGFTDKTLSEIFQLMKPLIRVRSPFAEEVPVNRKVTWIKPVLVANIKYSEITEDGRFRHPVFMGLRIDKPATEAKTVRKNTSHEKNPQRKKRKAAAGR